MLPVVTYELQAFVPSRLENHPGQWLPMATYEDETKAREAWRHERGEGRRVRLVRVSREVVEG